MASCLLLVVVASAAQRPASAATTPWLWGRLDRGSWPVGVRLIAAVDSARRESMRDGSIGARPMELIVWYPAVPRRLTRDAISFSTYVDLSDGPMTTSTAGHDRAWQRRWLADAISRSPESVSTSALDRVLSSRMEAVLDAPRRPDRLPLILWSTRHATPAAQSVLSEYLASHGYVVAWMRYAGADSLPPPYDNVSAERKRGVLEAHVADMQWAIGRLARDPAIDSTRIAVAAWSYSGEPATVLAQRTPGIRLVMSLSSNVFVPTYRSIDMAASLDSTPLRADVAVLADGRSRSARAEEQLLDRVPGKAYRVTFATLAHGNFNVLEGMIPGLIGVTSVQPWSLSGVRAQAGYEAICRAVLALADKNLKGAPGNRDEWMAHAMRALDSVTFVRHGPGRLASSTRGTSFVDERVVLPSDEWRVVGNFVRPTNAQRVPAVLLLNKANGDRRVYADVARELARVGIASLRLDLRGEGESTNRGTFVPGVPNAAFDHEERDVVAALRWLRRRAHVDSSRLGVVGASYSGETMAIAARAGAAARAYVALSPGSLSAETIDGMDRSGAAWWILRSRDERFVRDVMDAVRARSRTARTTEVDGRAHATDMLESHPDLAAAIAAWFATELRK